MNHTPPPFRSFTSRAASSRMARVATALVLAALFGAGLAACGGGGDDAATTAPAAAPAITLSGVAATGAPISGREVRITNANGATSTVITAPDGSFTLRVTDAAPYLLTVTDAAGQTWYSYAAQAGVANITPLSTLALLQANGGRPLAALLANWGTTRIDPAAALAAAATLNANFQAQLQAQGLDPRSFNVFNSAFLANRSGFDAVLDALRITFNCTATACTQQIDSPAGATLLTWNANASTAGISLSFSGAGTAGSTTINVNLGACQPAAAGTWSMLVDTTVEGLAGVSIPQVCVNGLPGAPASQAEFCNSNDFRSQLPPGIEVLSCSYAGNVGTYSVRISSPVVISYTVKYTFVQR